MLDVFSPLKKLLKLDAVCIDNNIFRLHYKATAILLLVFMIIVSCKQYIEKPIQCIADKGVPEEVMNSFCWIHTTFTIPTLNRGRIGKDVLQPGVASHTDKDEVKYHQYYQWVCFVLFFQASFFYIPRYLWKTWEGGKLKMLVSELNNPVLGSEVKTEKLQLLVNYLITHLHQHNFYAIRFFFCEVLNFLNVVGQMYLMDCFLDGEFTTYGSEVIRFTAVDSDERGDPMARVFPTLTKCTFNKYGASGTIEVHDALCVLPLNSINEKIYICLWFWFVLLAVCSGLCLIYRVGVITVRHMRIYLLHSYAQLTRFEEMEIVIDQCHIGDWFILYQLSKNIDFLTCSELISNLGKMLKPKESV